MFTAFDPDIRINLAVVAFGAGDRLARLLAMLTRHDSRHEFCVICVVNPDARQDAELEIPVPQGVRLVRPELNLGWAGGLHAARSSTRAEFLVWVQDDMTVSDGWLDALVDAAEQHPEIGAFGSVSVDASGKPVPAVGGSTVPPEDIAYWNDTDLTGDLPTEVTAVEWITGKGMLTRTSVWDEVGGADPRLYPLHHVDKDYGIHLRSHGWAIAIVPDARLIHEGQQSAPSLFRYFLRLWVEPDFNARWGHVARTLSGINAAIVEHECSDWHTLADVERLVGIAASRLLVPSAKYAAKDAREVLDRELALRDHLAALTETLSWRITRPLRAIRSARRTR